MIRVLLADDHELVRTGFRLIVDAQPDMTTIGAVGDGGPAVAAARELRPDVILMDLHMPDIDGVTATSQIVGEIPGVRVLVLSTFDLDDNVVAALRAGASGFLPKDVSPEELVEGIRIVHRGESAVAPRLLTRLIGSFVSANRRKPPRTSERLTEREKEVLVLIASGRSNDEISHDLDVSPSTVKNHVTNIFGKIGARDRAQAVIYAYETGIVTPRLD